MHDISFQVQKFDPEKRKMKLGFSITLHKNLNKVDFQFRIFKNFDANLKTCKIKNYQKI